MHGFFIFPNEENINNALTGGSKTVIWLETKENDFGGILFTR